MEMGRQNSRAVKSEEGLTAFGKSCMNARSVCQPTIVYVARMAKVSTATVSRALNGFPGVSKQTRDAVERAASLSGYKANPSAAKLGRSNAGMVKKRRRNEVLKGAQVRRSGANDFTAPASGLAFARAQIIDETFLLLEIDLRQVKHQVSKSSSRFLLQLSA